MEVLDDESEYFLYDQLAGETPPRGRTRSCSNRLSGEAILDAIANLPENFREAVVLVDVGDFSYQDAAEILDVPIGTVMSRLHRGRRLLKRALAEQIPGGDT